jgi:hypothetical protein
MAERHIVSILAKYFRDMKNQATSFDKFYLLASICLWLGCGIGAYKGLTASMHWPKALVLFSGIIVIAVVWLVGFSLGVSLRAPRWEHVFPPYGLIGKAVIPALLLAILSGSLAGMALFDISLNSSAIASFWGYIGVTIVMLILFLIHTPWTRAAVRLTRNPNVMTVDSHRFIWFFPALGVLAIFFIAKRFVPAESEAIRHIATTAAIATSTTLAGFGAGYIP